MQTNRNVKQQYSKQKPKDYILLYFSASRKCDIKKFEDDLFKETNKYRGSKWTKWKPNPPPHHSAFIYFTQHKQLFSHLYRLSSMDQLKPALPQVPSVSSAGLAGITIRAAHSLCVMFFVCTLTKSLAIASLTFS